MQKKKMEMQPFPLQPYLQMCVYAYANTCQMIRSYTHPQKHKAFAQIVPNVLLLLKKHKRPLVCSFAPSVSYRRIKTQQ